MSSESINYIFRPGPIAARQQTPGGLCGIIPGVMIEHQLREDDGILIVSPEGPLAASDFETLAGHVDPYIEANGKLQGLLIHTPSFPGWENFAAMAGHFKFVRDHHHKIQRVAAVTDDGFLKVMPTIVDHFVNAEVRHFAYGDKDKALAWIAELESDG